MASTKDIATICNGRSVLPINKTLCLQILTAYPPAVSAPNIVKLVKIVVGLGESKANKTADFVAGLVKEPTFKQYFKACNDAYKLVVGNFRSARLELEDNETQTASYDILVSMDDTEMVKNTIGKNTDKASKTLMEMTLVMEDYIGIAFTAVDQIDK
ncbi:unnamed protein product [Eruca vesicaria subsp. sativa]|uniref:Pectinesterase inhibitor domain-containing protein n=1 Tax=Eruca vesicaria subsp. sativa TaxID=29727 RepID=A0ABC8JI52_ERUVS|nr:unnamed protein product [Eruca vesicaria subsp. sativa]CAH8327132.1 unnamed protein product [Eruca vesicaria subsp. sativa]